MEPQAATSSTGSLDPQAVALAKAIRQQESGNNPTLTGKSGEYGAYQFLPDTWAKYSKEAGVDVPLEQATLQQQNQVAYYKIKQWKDSGLNPGQIASEWNAGPGEPDAYLGQFSNGQPSVGTNNKGVSYNVPAYATNVAKYYQQFKPETAQVGGQPQQSSQNPGLADELGSRIGQGEHGISLGLSGASDVLNGNIGSGLGDIAQGVLQTGGAVAGAVNDVTTKGLELIPGVKSVENAVGGAIGDVLQTPGAQQAVNDYESWATNHPELANDIGAGANILSSIPILKGIGSASGLVSKGITKAVGRSTGDAVLQKVTGPLTAGQAVKAVASRGTEKVGLLGKTVIPADREAIAAKDAILKHVPKFDPSKSFVDNIAVTRNATNKLAASLEKEVEQKGAGRIYSYKELGSYLRNLPRPLSLVGDNTKQYNRLLNAAMDIAKEKGGQVPNLLGVRKEFDQLVADTWPNLYSSDTLTPLRMGVKNIRNGLTKFTAAHLPEDVALQAKLLDQHNLLNAIENMAANAVKAKEIGATDLTRLAQKFPRTSGLVKRLSRAALMGAGIKEGGVLAP